MFRSVHTVIVAIAAVALLAPAAVQAQTYILADAAPRGWLGISFQHERLGEERGGRPIARVIEVVEGSPAERAGLLPGDTILTVNNIAASQQLLNSLAHSLSPGESVELRVIRSNVERTVTIVTAERPAGVDARQTYEFDLDAIRSRARIMLDSALIQLDSARLPNIILNMPARGEAFTAEQWHRFGDNVRIDTIAPGRIRIEAFGGDPLLRAELDSVTRRLSRNVWIDGRLPLSDDSARVIFRGAMPGASFDGVTFFARAVAGAELADVEPAMESYFGTAEGVLVLRVGDRTPAAAAGLQPGDVIVGVDDVRVTTANELRRRVAASTSGEPLQLDVLRERRALRLQLGREQD